MSIRNLDHLFRPKSIALVGASKSAASVGAVVARNLLRGGFDGPVMPVNPRHRAVEGVLAYPDVASLPVVPDLAVIATPPETIPGIVDELAQQGTRAAVVISAGFAELGAEGAELQDALFAAASPHLLRVVGPNCLGILVPGIGLNASFAQLNPVPGSLAFVAQSGAIVTSVLDWAHARGIGFSHLVSLGDMVDVDFGDMLDYLANDSQVSAILLYIEGVTHPRKFMSAARAAARMKPVIVVKSGRFEESSRAAASHTGALAGSDAVFDTAIRRAGMLRVHSLEGLFDAVETLATATPPKGDRIAIITNGGGIGVLAADAIVEEGARLAELSPETLARLDAVLPHTWSGANPVDIIGDAQPDRYGTTLDVVLDDPGVDAVLVANCPTAVASSADAAQAVIDVVRKHGRRTVFTCWVGDISARAGRRLFSDASIPTYDTPGGAVSALMDLVDYRRNQESLMETPPSVPADLSPDVDRARRAVLGALGDGRSWLSATETAEVLDAYEIPGVPTEIARDPEEAAALSATIDGPVALKLLSPDITHKTDVGGVVLDLSTPQIVADAARAMLGQVATSHPEARVEGVAVQPMIHERDAFELIVGAAEDPNFGPVVMFGQGGTAVDLLADRAIGLPPLNMHLARGLISQTRFSRLLGGYRGHRGADLDAIALTLIRIAQLIIDIPEIVELDINPLLASHDRVLALDTRIRVQPTTVEPTARLAIRPYPSELEETITLGDGRTLFLRPILPEDEPSLHATFATLTPEEIRLRFFAPIRTLSHMVAARFTQLDYDREMALILTDTGRPGTTEIYGVVSINADADNRRAEYAVIVRHDMTGLGLGPLLMRRIIDYAGKRGIREIWGEVLTENLTMRKLCRVLGFREEHEPGDPTIVRVSLELTAP